MSSKRVGLKACATISGRAGLKACAATIALLVLPSCGGPTAPSAPAPTIACPAAQSATSTSGAAVVVTYPFPTVTGGSSPFIAACSPPSGSSFPVGTTTVTCNVQDADQRTASCRFTVSVTRPPQLTATRFTAFGDSITAGALGTECPAGGGVNCSVTTFTERRLLLQRLFVNLEVSPVAYPRVLQSLLTARYTTQNAVVANEGIPGEGIAAGKDRLAIVLSQQTPQVLLLQEGANDMNQARPPIDVHVEDLRTMVRAARASGVTVFVGTLLPQRPNACRGYDFCDGVNDTVSINSRIRSMVAAEGAMLVDLYTAFDGQTNTLLGLDGLHPNETGYRRMAELFFEAIRQRLETP